MIDLGDVLNSVLTDYHRQSDLRMVPVRVNDIKPLLEQRGFVDRFVWEEFSFPSQNVIAQVVCYRAGMGAYAGQGDYARIQYSCALNYCWKRMAICKEMYQCLLDTPPGHRITSAEQLLQLGELFVSDQYAAVTESFPPFVTESLAEVAAIETLFPLELRVFHEEAYDAGELTDYQLALRYRIPEKYVHIAMSPRYRDAISRIRTGKLVAI